MARMKRAVFFVVLAVTSPLFAQHVSDPKASLIDVQARIELMKKTKEPLLRDAKAKLASCRKLPEVAAPATPINIPRHYLNGSHGPTNPAEAAATKVYGQFENRITAGMNRYVATGNQKEAKCALDQLDTWRKGGALLDYDPKTSSQAWYQVEWTLSSAGVTESVLVTDKKLDQAKLQQVNAWLNQATHKMIAFEGPNDLNNHHYWRALAAMSVGVLSSDDDLFQYAVKAYEGAIDELDQNGAFPREMARNERASHYQTFALQPLVPLAEFAARQNVDLYGYAPNGGSIEDAIIFFGRSVDDPSIIKQYTPEKQDEGFGGGDYAPYIFFHNRYPQVELPPSITTALQKPLGSSRIGGSITVLGAK